MEELLNKLIEKGWKPFGIQHHIKAKYYWYNNVCFFVTTTTILWNVKSVTVCNCSLRDIVSINSLLRQFVCKNSFLKWPDSTDEWQKNPIWASFDELFYASQYQFYLIECALKNNSELEQFLIDNIKIEW